MQRTRGYALVLVLGISLVLTIGVGTMLSFLASAQKTSMRQRLNREAFYVCDGVSRTLMKVTSDTLSSPDALTAPTPTVTPTPTLGAETGLGTVTPTPVTLGDADTTTVEDDVHLARLKLRVQTRLNRIGTLRSGAGFASILPPGYEEDGDGFAFTYVDTADTSGVVRAGRFTGMSGSRRHFAFELALRKVNGSACSTASTVDMMRIPYGEFAVFSDTALRICPSWATADVTRTARYHVNGNLDVGAVALPRTTIFGTLRRACGGPAAVAVVNGALGSPAHVVSPIPNVRFCVADGCTSTNTQALSNTSQLSLDVFSDASRGTSPLHLPGLDVKVQDGRDAGNNNPVSNDGSMRYLIDPGLPTDTSTLKVNRLAHIALVRIIDGVWYLNDGTWPGQAIWSDHPGNFDVNTSTLAEERTVHGAESSPRDVGRAAVIPSGTAMPRGYSWFDDADTDPDTDGGVVSYGRLTLVAGSGHLPQIASGASGTPLQKAKEAARDGFVDRHAYARDPDRGPVYPLNFDLGAFVAALDNTGENELRARIDALPTSVNRDPQRVIVWIGSTWSGSLRGLENDDAALLPPAPDDDELDEIPYALCQRPDDDDDDDDVYCDDDDGDNARINAVRVVNGGAQLPAGRRITIATHLPLYVLGSIDRAPAGTAFTPPPTEMPGGTAVEFGSAASPCNTTCVGPDVFFAADSVTLLSDAWTDRGWDIDENDLETAAGGGLRTTEPVIVNASILTGRTTNGTGVVAFGLERAVRFLERWSGAANTSPVVTGSILLGFDSVFSPWPVCYQRADSTCAGDSPWRHFWSSKLLDQAGQPPGMPSFTLRAVGETVPDSQRFNFAAFLRLFESLRVSLGIGGNVGVSFE